MAEIAMLVAEEYERMVKSSRKNGEEIELLSCVGIFGHGLKEKLGMEKKKVVEVLAKGVSQPKSQMSLAASNGFFSA